MRLLLLGLLFWLEESFPCVCSCLNMSKELGFSTSTRKNRLSLVYLTVSLLFIFDNEVTNSGIHSS
jgi:hypothetical protein